MIEHNVAVVLAVPAEGNGLAIQCGNTLGRFNLGDFDDACGIHEIPFLRLLRGLGRGGTEKQCSSQRQKM